MSELDIEINFLLIREPSEDDEKFKKTQCKTWVQVGVIINNECI